MGLGTRLTKLESQGQKHGLLRSDEQMARRLGGALVALIHWATQSRLLDQAELTALRAAINDPVGTWSLNDPRLPIALKAERKVPTAHLRAVHEAWQAWYLNVVVPRGGPRRAWLRDNPPCLPLGRLAFAAHNALKKGPSIAEQNRTLEAVHEIFGGVPCFVRGPRVI